MMSLKGKQCLSLVMRNNLILFGLCRKKKKKRLWVRNLWTYREEAGHQARLITEMKLFDHNMFFNYFRMRPSTFEELLQIIGPSIQKKDTNFRKSYPAIPPLKLAMTLRYLATGESQALLSFNFRIGHKSLVWVWVV